MILKNENHVRQIVDYRGFLEPRKVLTDPVLGEEGVADDCILLTRLKKHNERLNMVLTSSGFSALVAYRLCTQLSGEKKIL